MLCFLGRTNWGLENHFDVLFVSSPGFTYYYYHNHHSHYNHYNIIVGLVQYLIIELD